MPKFYQPYNVAQLTAMHAYQVGEMRQCLTDAGYPPDDPPSLEKLISDWRNQVNPRWFAYDNVPDARHPQIEKLCPLEPEGFYDLATRPNHDAHKDNRGTTRGWRAARRRAGGFVFQDAALDASRKVIDSVAEPALYAGSTPSAARARARELMERMGVAARRPQAGRDLRRPGASRPARRAGRSPPAGRRRARASRRVRGHVGR
jgi:hypothetical protein